MRGRIAGALVMAALGCGKTEATPHVVWNDLESGDALARREHKPSVVFFYASWSHADVQLDRESFADRDVRTLMKDFVPIKIDATDTDDPNVLSAEQRFKVVGVPTIIVRDASDPPREVYRAMQYLSPAELATALRTARPR